MTYSVTSLSVRSFTRFPFCPLVALRGDVPPCLAEVCRIPLAWGESTTQVCYSGSLKRTPPRGAQHSPQLRCQHGSGKVAVGYNAINRERRVFCTRSRGKRNTINSEKITDQLRNATALASEQCLKLAQRQGLQRLIGTWGISFPQRLPVSGERRAVGAVRGLLPSQLFC